MCVFTIIGTLHPTHIHRLSRNWCLGEISPPIDTVFVHACCARKQGDPLHIRKTSLMYLHEHTARSNPSKGVRRIRRELSHGVVHVERRKSQMNNIYTVVLTISNTVFGMKSIRVLCKHSVSGQETIEISVYIMLYSSAVALCMHSILYTYLALGTDRCRHTTHSQLRVTCDSSSYLPMRIYILCD